MDPGKRKFTVSVVLTGLKYQRIESHSAYRPADVTGGKHLQALMPKSLPEPRVCKISLLIPLYYFIPLNFTARSFWNFIRFNQNEFIHRDS